MKKNYRDNNPNEILYKTEELLDAASNRYKMTIQIANRAKRRRYQDIDLVEEVDLLESIDLEPDSPPTNLDHADFIKWSKAASGYPYSYFECYKDSILSEIPKEICINFIYPHYLA